MKILVATTNKSKSDRIEKTLTGLDFEVQNLNDLDWTLEIDENKDTFEEKAMQKNHWSLIQEEIRRFITGFLLSQE